MEDDGIPLIDKFKKAESTVNDVIDGSTVSKEALEECVKTLKALKSIIETTMDLFSSNESIEDIPTSSLQYLLVEPYLAVAIENINVPITKRVDILQESKKFYNEFLLNADIYGFNPLPSRSKDADVPPSLARESQLRQQKIEIASMQSNLADEVKKLAIEWQRSGDEDVKREMSLKKLQLWCIKSMNNIEQISRELPFLEHRKKLEQTNTTHDPTEAKPPPLKTFVIPKMEAKQKVFGRGYPSAPTQTVNEWYDHMVDSGRFPGSSAPTQTKEITSVEDEDENMDEDKDLDNEEERQKRIQKDEYLDTHRRGWGNKHGKG